MLTTRLLFTSVGLASFLAFAGLAQPGGERPSHDAATPEVIALEQRADWCQASERLAPTLQDARELVSDQPVLFLSVDYSTEATTRQSEYLLGLLDAQEVWGEYGLKTGVVVLIDPETHEVLGTLHSEMTADEMADTIRAAAER